MRESKREARAKVLALEYPYNLLNALVNDQDLTLPENLTADRSRGLQYALSTLDAIEYEILMYRYQEHMTLKQIGDIYSRSVERIRQHEHKALRKLRQPSRWNYIKLGVAGYWQHRKKVYYDMGYKNGYNDGYDTGRMDERNGKVEAYKSNPLLNLTIENLGLSTRAFQCLRRMNCDRIGDVVIKEPDDIWRTRNMGKITADEIARTLRKHDITGTAWDQFLLPEP